MTAVAISHDSGRQRSLIALGVILSAIAISYKDTFASIVAIWSTSEAFAHGFAIFPISAVLIWQRRHDLNQLRCSYSRGGTIALAFLSLLWWLSDLLGIQLIAQLAVVAMIPTAVLAVVGEEIVSCIRFPLAYLVFAVPFGEFLIPQLIDITAKFSVFALNVFGIPVYLDGRYFHVPSGSFEVAKACSGLKYLLSTLALTTLFSHLMFRRISIRTLFVVFSIGASIFANGVRATVIVTLLHYTDIDVSQGLNHFLVGWIIYLILLLAIIYVGAKLHDPVSASSSREMNRSAKKSVAITIKTGGMASTFLAIVLGPILAMFGLLPSSANGVVRNGLPNNVGGWTSVAAQNLGWQPDYQGYSDAAYGTYHRGSESVNVAMFKYVSQRQGEEIVSATNQLADMGSWRLGNVQTVPVETGADDRIDVREVLAWRSSESRLIWSWVEVNGQYVDGIFWTKLAEGLNLLARKTTVSTAVVLSTRVARGQLQSRQVLQDFAVKFYGRLRSCMDAEVVMEDCRIGAGITETR